MYRLNENAPNLFLQVRPKAELLDLLPVNDLDRHWRFGLRVQRLLHSVRANAPL